MTIDKEEMQVALEKVKPGLANKEIIEQSTSFAFMGDKVVTYNDEVSISHPVKNLDVVGAVKAQELYQFLNKVKTKTIDLEWENEQVRITAGKSKAGLVMQKEVVLPIDEIGDVGRWKPIPERLAEAMQFCRTSCSRDMSRPILTCVHVQQDGTVEASDGFRVTRYTVGATIPVKPFLIPVTSVGKLSGYRITHIAEGTGWVHFKSDEGTVFSCRVFEENYPSVDYILDFEGTPSRLPASMSDALERASIFVKSEYNFDSLVTLTIQDSTITISAQAESGWFEEELRIRYKGDPVSFKVNPQFLIDMLSADIDKCSFGSDRVKFEGDNWVHVVALLKGA